MIVVIQDFLVSSCNMSLCSLRKSTTGRTMLATYAEAFDGICNKRVTELVQQVSKLIETHMLTGSKQHSNNWSTSSQ